MSDFQLVGSTAAGLVHMSVIHVGQVDHFFVFFFVSYAQHSYAHDNMNETHRNSYR